MKSRNIAELFVGPQGLRAGWGILLFAAAFVAIAALLAFISLVALARALPGDLPLFLTEVVELVAVLGSTAIMARVERRSAWDYGLLDPRSRQRFLRGMVWGVALLSLLVVGLLASGQVELAWRHLSPAEIIEYGAAYAAGLFVVALAEEMLLRGYLQVTLARLIGFWPAAGVLSLAFGFMHGGNPGESTMGVASAVLIGGVLCLCLRRSGSLCWGIGFHAAWDWAQAFLWGTPVSGFVLEGRLMEARALGDPLWSGGDTGPEGSVLIVPVLALAVVVIARSFGRSGPAEPVSTGRREA